MSGMLPAMSTATNPTGSDPAAATRPALSCATPAVSSGHAGGMAASQSLSTHSRVSRWREWSYLPAHTGHPGTGLAGQQNARLSVPVTPRPPR